MLFGWELSSRLVGKLDPYDRQSHPYQRIKRTVRGKPVPLNVQKLVEFVSDTFSGNIKDLQLNRITRFYFADVCAGSVKSGHRAFSET